MVTPEVQRKRQLEILKEVRIGLALLIIMAAATAWGYYNSQREAAKTQECLETTVQELTGALKTRAASTNALGDLTNDRVDLLSELLSDVSVLVLKPVPSEQDQGDAFRELLTQYQADLAELNEQKEELTKERAKTPYPDYPEGKCD